MMLKLPPRTFGRSTREAADKARSQAHRKWIRSFACILHDRNECEGPTDCCHVKTGNGATNRSKAGDQKTLPMCRRHHDIQTKLGEARFEIAYKIDMNQWADTFAAASPALRKLVK